MLWILIFVFSLFLLIKSSDYFTNSAEKIGLWFKMSPFVVGVTIVAFGTSLPELVSSIFAVLRNNSELVAGNVMGSNIANICLVLGLASIFAGNIKIKKKSFNTDLAFFMWSAVFIFVFSLDGFIYFYEGIILFVMILFYIYLSLKTKHDSKVKQKMNSSIIIVFLLSIVGIYFGAKYTIDSLIYLADFFGLGTDIIGATILALGTSLPEASVSLVSVFKKKTDLAIGNIIGSNIFNSFVVYGVASFFGVLTVTPSILNFTLPMMLLATLLCLLFCSNKHISRKEGIVLFIIYLFFMIKLLV